MTAQKACIGSTVTNTRPFAPTAVLPSERLIRPRRSMMSPPRCSSGVTLITSHSAADLVASDRTLLMRALNPRRSGAGRTDRCRVRADSASAPAETRGGPACGAHRAGR